MELKARPLDRAAFAPFGEVIETHGAERFAINAGTTMRYHDLARIDVADQGGRPLINIFRAVPRALPLEITLMERHPLGSQAFIPLSGQPFLVVVAPAGERVEPADLRAFVAEGGQGVNYRKGVWHHTLIALEAVSDFLVIDRGGAGDNLDEVHFEPGAARVLLTL